MEDRPASVLVVDDDEELCAMLAEYLGGFGFAVESRHGPEAGLDAVRAGRHDAVVLDVMMPGMDGVEACRRIREFSSVPVMMLTARGDTADKVLGLGVGADDYLPKPFEPRELAARLEALVRRHRRGLERAEVGGLELSQRSGKAFLDGGDGGGRRDIGLTDSEFAVLAVLVRNRPGAVSREEIFTLMRGYERDVSDRSIDILVSRLRAKLGDDPAKPRFIRTVRTVGYAFIA